METRQKELFEQIFRPSRGREGHKKWFEIVHCVVMIGDELSDCQPTDAFSHGELTSEGGEAKKNATFHGKMPAFENHS